MLKTYDLSNSGQTYLQSFGQVIFDLLTLSFCLRFLCCRTKRRLKLAPENNINPYILGTGMITTT